MSYEIRKTALADIPNVIRLLLEFAEYEKLLDHVDTTEEKLRRAMFGEGAFVEGLVAVVEHNLAGYAIFYPNFASFRGQPGLYLEDIYISAAHRGRGLGETMIREIARLARTRGFERIDFQVLDWNTPAIEFYKKLGAVRDETERHFKFTDEAFANLAS